MEPPDAANTPSQNTNRTTLRIWVIPAVVVALLVITASVWLTGLGSYIFQRVAYTAKPPTFSGSSESLQQTVIVPTLDSPCPPDKNIIWCSSFQLAWNEVKDNVIHAPLQVIGAEETAARLNQAKQSTSDLESNSFYAAGGRTKDGIIGKIKKDMTAKFPSHPLPDLDQYDGVPQGILAYSYLTANALFKYPFEQGEKGLDFTDSHGARTEVTDFGSWPKRESQKDRIRKQVEVLYLRYPENSDGPDEYAIDLCRDSRPYQVVVAMVKPKDSLAETLAYARLQIEESSKRPDFAVERWLHTTDVVAVPEMFWKIEHHFSELIGRVVANAAPAMPIAEAMQTTEFRLDRRGAAVGSEAVLYIKAAPREFVFNRPFLVYMQKRGAAQPFFVMWVDNAELLTRK